jgi:glutathione S-transferase
MSGPRAVRGVRAAELTLVSHHLCPYVQRAAIALGEKGVAFERLYIDLGNKPGWFRSASPRGKVPLLMLGDGTVLFESSVICEFLEDTRPNPLHPSDPVERARHRAWMEFGSAILADVWGFETAPDAATTERKAGDLREKFAWVERDLGGGPWFAGDRFSLVDAAFGPVFRYFDVFDAIRDYGIFADVPKVQAWRRRLAERPSVRDAVSADYPARLRAFLKSHDAYLHRLAA